jgi:hypothetical protein
MNGRQGGEECINLSILAFPIVIRATLEPSFTISPLMPLTPEPEILVISWGAKLEVTSLSVQDFARASIVLDQN